MSLNQTLRELTEAFPIDGRTMPALFVGHGNPMNAIEENEFSRTWESVGAALPRPRAILCVSAHWETQGTKLTAMENPPTIHDFGGFPKPLFEVQYPAPGSPALARLTQETLHETPVALSQEWGFDHGTWSVLCRMFPKAEVPVVQLSLDRTEPPAFHYALGNALQSLRHRGVLIVGSGNIVHNLARIRWEATAPSPWAIEFDEAITERIVAGDHDAVVHYEKLGTAAALAVPTNEHYLPLLYVLGLRTKDEAVRFFAERIALNSISMRSLQIG